MENIRKLPAQEERVETGSLQFGDDWPGTFIRGDSGAYYAGLLTGVVSVLRNPKNKSPFDVFTVAQLEQLAALLDHSSVGPYGEEFRAHRENGQSVSSYEYSSAGFIIDGPKGMSFAPEQKFVESTIKEVADVIGDDPRDYTATEVFFRGSRGALLPNTKGVRMDDMRVVVSESDETIEVKREKKKFF